MSRGQYVSEPYTYPGGGVAVGIRVKVLHRGTFVPATIFYSAEGTARRLNPIPTGVTGQVSFWIDPGEYDLLANGVRTPFDVDSGEGGAGGGSTFIHHQTTPLDFVSIPHPLGTKPTVDVIDDDGNQLMAEIDWPSDSVVTVAYSPARTYTVYLRS